MTTSTDKTWWKENGKLYSFVEIHLVIAFYKKELGLFVILIKAINQSGVAVGKKIFETLGGGKKVGSEEESSVNVSDECSGTGDACHCSSNEPWLLLENYTSNQLELRTSGRFPSFGWHYCWVGY